MFEKILLALDGSESSKKAASVVTEMARKDQSEVVVLHVREREISRGGAYDMETPSEAHELVDWIVRTLKDKGVSARGELRSTTIGQVPRVIVDEAKEQDAGLIAMGTRGLSDWGGLFLGSVTHKVLHLADRPVLVVH